MKPLESKPSKGELKRQKIIVAAARVLSAKGYSNTTMADIAREAGTQAGSLYYHFESRDHIVREVLTASMDVTADKVKEALAALPKSANFVAQLRAGVGAHLSVILSDEPFLPAYNRIINEVSQEIRDASIESPRRYAKMWHAIIVEAQERGELRAEIDPVLFRLLLFGSVTWAQLWFNPAGPRSIDDLLNQIVESFLYGALDFDE